MFGVLTILISFTATTYIYLLPYIFLYTRHIQYLLVLYAAAHTRRRVKYTHTLRKYNIYFYIFMKWVRPPPKWVGRCGSWTQFFSILPHKVVDVICLTPHREKMITVKDDVFFTHHSVFTYINYWFFRAN